jgi:hypothetical protein
LMVVSIVNSKKCNSGGGWKSMAGKLILV